MNILIGLVGLGVVVFVHELGHMLAAKAVGIQVEAFSLGWGRKLAGVTWRGTEYRISVFPIGGYCKMKGEQSYTRAIENNEDHIPKEPGSFFSAEPWQRILVSLAGPFANIVLAILILSIVWWVGFTVQTYDNRIVLASDFAPTPIETAAPADETDASAADQAPASRAGLQTGDVIAAIDGRDVRSYSDIQQIVAQNALTELDLTVLRDGRARTVAITPELVEETGAGYIGVYPWVEPVIETVVPESAAARAGFRSGDRIVSANTREIAHVWEFREALENAEDGAEVVVSRDDATATIRIPGGDNGAVDLAALDEGMNFRTVSMPTPDYNVFQAIGRGTAESVRILVVSVRSLRLLFQGVDLTSAVAGPVRISYFIGDIATSGFQIGFATGLRSLSNFLALLSVVLFFMNLLPIPVLDGGQIVLAGVEWIRRKTLHPRSVYRYQLVGSVLVFALLFFALFGDILFLAGR
ncbi:MAG: site-2 protease family protein [Spirochaetota bacterium]